MSIGITGKIFGKGIELYLGKRTFTHTLRLLKVSSMDLDDMLDFTLIEFYIAIRW